MATLKRSYLITALVVLAGCSSTSDGSGKFRPVESNLPEPRVVVHEYPTHSVAVYTAPDNQVSMREYSGSETEEPRYQYRFTGQEQVQKSAAQIPWYHVKWHWTPDNP